MTFSTRRDEEAAEKVQDLYLSGKKKEAEAAVPDELTELLSLCGPEGYERERIEAFRSAGVTQLNVRVISSPCKRGDEPAGHGTRPSAAGSTRGSSARTRQRVSSPAWTDARSATRAAWTALVTFDQDGDRAAAARIASTGEMLDTLAQTRAAHAR